MQVRNLRCLLLLLAIPQLAISQVVVNGDFEDVNIAPDFFSFDTSQLPGWTRGGSLGDGLLAHVGYSDSQGKNSIAGHGSQFAMLGGGFGAGATATLSTIVTGLTPGATYALAFLIANEGEAANQSITVSFPGGSSTPARTFTTAAPFTGLYWTTWEAEAMQFVATASSATLQFEVFNQQYDIGLDYVRVSPMSTTPLLQVSPSSLSFNALVGGDTPAPQAISVLATGAAVAQYGVTIDAGTANSSAPTWLSVAPSAGSTPARLVVSVNQNGLQAGSYTARIGAGVPSDMSQAPIDVAVTLVVTAAGPKLEALPAYLSFAAHSQSPGILDQALVVHNSGGSGAISFSAAVVSTSPWLSITLPNQTSPNAQTAPNAPALIHVEANTQGLSVGGYRGLIRLTASSNSVDIPIELFIADSGPILSLSVTGVRFQSRQNNGTSAVQTVNVLNLGDPGTTLNWTAAVAGTSPIINLGVNGGSATLSNPGALPLTLAANATTLAPGGYYALVTISALGALNSPQYVVAVLDQADAATQPKPDPSPQGLVFIGAAAGSQTITLNVDSASSVAFQASASTSGGGSWLSVTPATGTSSASAPAKLIVAANLAGLTPGIYTGGIDIASANSVRTVNVTAIVRPGQSAANLGHTADPVEPLQASCVPSRLALTYTGLVNNFAVPAGWPATLVLSVNDDCANPVTGAFVSVSFSNGDPPLQLRSDQQTGHYSATWQPSSPLDQTTITARASFGSLPPASAQLTGGVTANNFPAPVLAPHGTLNNLNAVLGAPLAPGTIAQLYGAGLASQTASPGLLPLPNVFNGTGIVVGGLPAPLYYLSSGQLDVQVPNELKPGQQYAILASVNNAYTLPDLLDLNPVTPGVAALADGTVIAQHADFSYVDASHPARPGETLTIYLDGMGLTNPAVMSGQTSPSMEPLGRVTAAPTVLVDSKNANVLFAGLTPGAVGLYQINFTVPMDSKSGTLDLVVMQSGVSANALKLQVGQ